ncbi:LSU ribosomal protein L18P [Olsenella uli DSM 7084]|uniref:Large ribosomal subunit protein uL18 n=1 Tax=Olsenella uli (strain ATCC 49627 / DSM 7084 / CCUG 31166 / CIP 109912 / JCM 12494 / LMG 11480 / NCIMB 702895 / VPI D76D-27C) TaxID=633147 RepID=E1QX39_OLSUV|nr:50S ribosomal protein L18 [Olsenella uli]ADK68692.1 LSU ribosomal protein L18P [Olsenella uli DSM 7084]EUB31224.1 ribosomal protein L18 [Olsenella uli MSTE5]KRO12167.1 50S ribosomal protein L18 [Olsenella uli DSM 7084]MBS6417663.1 50S ribosomal protein L18 [Olsenella uli]
MNKNKAKRAGLARRKRRVRAKVSGTAERPRLAVHRTNANIYAQLVDDTQANTLCAASTLSPEFRALGKVGSNKEAAEFVGKLIAERALAAGIAEVTFDRGGRIYHGRVQALADGARSAGLKF